MRRWDSCRSCSGGWWPGPPGDPIFITGTLLFAFRPEGKKWWDYLDQIWAAYEQAEALDLSVLPALQVRSRMTKEARDRGTASD